MTDDTILKKVLNNLGQIASETGKDAVMEVGKMTESVITGKALLGDIRPLTEAEMAQKQAEDKQKVDTEIKEMGRNVEGEVKEVQQETKQEEDQKEKEFLENIKRQREAEEMERRQLSSQNEVSTNPAKQKKSRGSAFVTGKKKSQQPDPAAMSQTNEMTGGKID
jgi:hypothetical protein